MFATPHCLTDDELSAHLLDLSDNVYDIYAKCSEMQFQTVKKIQNNDFNFDQFIPPDENFYKYIYNIYNPSKFTFPMNLMQVIMQILSTNIIMIMVCPSSI